MVRQECLDAGGTEDECNARAAEFAAECVRRCDQPPEPPDRCTFDCAAGAEALNARCVEAGNDPMACAERAAVFLEECTDFQEEHCANEVLAAEFGLPDFVRGDVNGDLAVDIADPIFSLDAQFRGTQQIGCGDAADANDSGDVDLSDAVYELVYLFNGGREPPAPFSAPGQDPTADDLDCEVYPR
jgi:hypothetical protein